MPIMRRMNSKSVDLIYLDPPFNSKTNYAAPIGSKAAGSEFKDTWNLDDIDKEWIRTIAKKHPKLYRILLASITDSNKSYLAYMSPRIIEMHRILKDMGSIYLHCDPTMSHHLKLVLDAIFGWKNFRNEIIWHYNKWTNTAKMFQRNHDVIFYYVKSPGAMFNKLEGDLTRRQIQLQEAGYNLGSSGGVPIVRIYDESKCADKIEYWEKEGRAIYYVEESTGNSLPDVWEIPILNGRSNERTGFRTQKPLTLLDRIIDASSKEGDIVFDPFCGCATTLVAAEFRPQRRRWVGIDISPKAAELVVGRIKDNQGMFDDIIPRRDIPQRTDLGKLPPPRSWFEHLYGKQRGYCNGCKEHRNPNICEVDHIIAKSKGGTDHVDNLQILCRPCNIKKGNKSMEYLTLANKELKKILEIM